jgi:Carboxymuconolactone decarboxylase family
MNMRLRFHINAALDAGATAEEIVASLYDFAPYFGTALARHALCVALEEFARRTPRAVESGRGEQRAVRRNQKSARRVWLS